jgi:8-oxo-dGTP pyrophosphatase MutT (NUDIX family)
MSTYDFCNNCGKTGHLYHQCKKPITSTGIVLFRNNSVENKFEYLMICRKDTLGYVDFLRGKYPINNRIFIKNLINEMTTKEKEKIVSTPFKELWKNLWGARVTMQYKNEEKMSEDKFNLLKYGISSKNDKFCLQDLIDESNTNWDQPEWGFPKGRRNHMENDLNCGIREFEEETGIDKENIDIIKNLLPIEEIFTGSNLKSYKHKYYLANIKNDKIDTCNYQKSEVSNMKWFSLEKSKNIIRPYNYERIELIEQVDKILHKYSLI